jgi:hypothetical protein
MSTPSRVPFLLWRASRLVTLLLALVAAAVAVSGQAARTPPAPTASPTPAQKPAMPPAQKEASASTPPGVNALAVSLQEFKTRLDQYIRMRADFSSKLKPLLPTDDAATLAARQESLATAIKMARAKAKRGDLIPPRVAQLIATSVREDFKRRNPTAKVGVFEEVPDTSAASLINKTYPAELALPTVPPLLLGNLPTLPDNLQYRFVGRDVAILDGDLQIVIDYVPRVLPPH